MRMKTKKILVVSITAAVLLALYILGNVIPEEAIKQIAGNMPIAVAGLILAIVDGFNPCNIFILTLLLSMMLSESHSRKKIFSVGFTFIGVVFLFYFIVMAFMLNVLQFIGLITPLRIIIGIVAIVAGIINMKELFFYRKGVTLMIQDKYLGPVRRRIEKVSKLMKEGSTAKLIGASAVLAIFASLVELPCTSGFPLFYTTILSAQTVVGLNHYLYLLLYNLIYIVPLLIIIIVMGFTFHGKAIKKDTMSIIKYIGGFIMFIVGILMLFVPKMIGLG